MGEDGVVGFWTRAAVAVLVGASLVACSASTDSPTATPPATSSSPAPSVAPFVPSESSEIYRPVSAAPGSTVPVVLTIPGGSWQTANREYLAPLAQRLAAGGAFVVNSTYRAGDVGALFPLPVQDVRCAAAYAVASAAGAGYRPGPVVLVGHSAGGHLVALAAVSGDALAAPCADPVPHIDGVVGLAGVYDAAEVGGLIAPFFGVARAADPALWDSGDPIHYVRTGRAPTPLSVLLVHGQDDEVVPLAQSQSFSAALRAARIPVAVDVLRGEDHLTIVDPAVSGDAIAAFVAALATGSAATPAA